MPDSFEAVVVASDGAPLAGARVRIRPEHWTADSGLAPEPWQTRTDREGRAELSLAGRSGAWSLEIVDAEGARGRFLREIPDSLRAAGSATWTLAPLSRLVGTVPLSATDSVGRILLEGTDRAVRPTASGAWSFDDLGPGSYRVIWSRPGPDSILADSLPLASGDTLRVGPPAPRSLEVAGRLVPVVGWDSATLPLAGWTVRAIGDTASATTRGDGSFTLTTTSDDTLRIRAIEPRSGASVTWDTLLANQEASRLDLPAKLAKRGDDTSRYVLLRIDGPQGVLRPFRVRAAPDTTALRSTGTPKAARALLPAMTGWTDDSGRFALAQDASVPYHVTLLDSVSGMGAVFPWGKDAPDPATEGIPVGSPGSANVTVRFPEGTPGSFTRGGILLSSMGTPELAQAVLSGQPTTFASLLPGRHRIGVVSLESAQPIAGSIDVVVTPGGTVVVDTLLTPLQVEDTADWPAATLLSIEGSGATGTLHDVTVRLDLGDVLDLAAYPQADLGTSLRFHDEAGRWVPAVATRWSPSEGIATFALLLDSLPSDGRAIVLRHGLSNAPAGGYSLPRFVFRRSSGLLARFAGGTSDQIPTGRILQAEGLAYEPGVEHTQAFRFDAGTRASLAVPSDTLGTNFGAQLVIRPSSTAPDSEQVLGLRALPVGEEVASLGTRAGQTVLRVADPDSGPREIALDGFTIARGTRCVVGLRRLGDTLEVSLASASGTVHRRYAASWPAQTDSVEFAAGADGRPGFAGSVDALTLHDGSWSEERASFEAAWWIPGAHRVRTTELR